jgi:hypothetical protein
MADRNAISPMGVVLAIVLAVGFAIAVLEQLTGQVADAVARGEDLSGALRPALPLVRAYLPARAHVVGHWYLYGPAVVIGPTLILVGLRRFAASTSRMREQMAGMALETPDYGLSHPFASVGARDCDPIGATRAAFARAMLDNPAPDTQVVLGLDEDARPIYLTDRARSMHVHLLGQTGSGKTRSVIYPLLWQDAWRGRPLLFLDAKGSIENEQTLASIAAATGRADELRIFTLNPARRTQTYNPLHLTPNADPRAVAERVFATFADEMDNPYYRNQARILFTYLVRALAATNEPMCLLDVAACVSDRDVLHHALSLSDDRTAVRRIEAAVANLGDRYHQTYSGLVAALSEYDHPAVNAYEPDIVLEDLLGGRGIVGFSLSANAYKFLARAIGLIVLQHVQQLGAARQQDRGLDQTPLYVYADEFYTFAYEGFVDAVNKLRDANVSMLLSHQSLADLDRVSREYARAIWDNTRNKVVLYQNDSELCERLASALGTRQEVELTVRRSADAWLNQASMLEASSRRVDSFVLHPSRLKNLRPGQAYLVQAGVGDAPVERASSWRARLRWGRPAAASAVSAARVVGANLAMLAELPEAPLPEPRDACGASERGLRLYERFLDVRGGSAAPPGEQR